MTIEDEAGDQLKRVVARVEDCRRQILKLRKIMDGLSEFASIRDEIDPGDWIVVSSTADLVSRCLKELNEDFVEIVDPGDTGDA